MATKDTSGSGFRPAGLARIGINAQKLSSRHSYHAAGISRYVLNLLKELRDLEPPETIHAYVCDAHLPPDLAPTQRFRIHRAQWPTDFPAMRVLWEQLRLPQALRHDRITLFHGAVNALPIGWRGPSVVTVLDLTFLLMPHAFNRANRTYLSWMIRLAARRASRIIAISEATRQDVIRLLGVAPQRVVKVYCGVDARFHPLGDRRALREFRDRRGLPERFILYLGTIEPRKNLIRLIDAYAQLRRRRATPLPLVLAGGRGWGDEAIMHHASRVGLADDVRFVGYVPEAEIPLWYNAAALFVYPSEYEGFGLPPLEALACGTPAVVSNRSSLPEVVGDSAILVDPADVGAIADGMQRALEDDMLRSRLSRAGPERARGFTWRRMAEETLSVYRAVSEDS